MSDYPVSVMLTLYRRPHRLQEQIAAIRSQTVKVRDMVIWQNPHPSVVIGGSLAELLEPIVVIDSGMNWGVWPRFVFCMEFTTPYVCVLDDDTIPGPKWLENCLRTMRTHEGLLGTIGVIFPEGTRRPAHRAGWAAPNEQVVEVDIAGHGWFFKRDWLRYYCLEPRQGTKTCGEDYHFSVSLQKHLGLGTYVPPHPRGDHSQWGSLHGLYGNDRVALDASATERQSKMVMHDAYLNAGWKPMALRSKA